ncbi:MAG TPA: glycosyltransferase family 2 protein [Acidimicrobiia bacterium]|nr:glycosyltransferase family 2 protein [Acidimicrobiia bacterium]
MSAPVSAVVVTYNAGDHLMASVRSILAQGVAEVVVVDNGSADGSLEALAAAEPGVGVVRPGRNLGYGAGANRGAAACRTRADHVLVCNADVRLEPGAVASMAAALEADGRRAIVGPRTENPDGTLYPSARIFPSLGDAVGHAALGLVAPGNRFTRRYRMLDWDHGAPREVDWVSGACLLVRRSAFAALDGFDEAYFMYLEDVDLCWRAWRAGWTVSYEPGARVVHAQGVSTDQRPYRMILAHHRSMLRFSIRSTRGWGRLLLPVVAAGLVARTVVACLHRLAAGARGRHAVPIAGGRG